MKSAALLFPVAVIALAACSQSEETSTAPVDAMIAEERADLISEGRAIVEENCTACHAIGAEGDSPRQDAPPLRTVFAEFDAEAIGDDFREGMDVILKPMNGILASVPGYCGTTLLGDGRVLLILDLQEML